MQRPDPRETAQRETPRVTRPGDPSAIAVAQHEAAQHEEEVDEEV